MDKRWLHEIDNAKADGWSLGIIISATVFLLVFSFRINFYLQLVIFLVGWFLCMAWPIMPHAKNIETKLFGLNNTILRRLAVVLVKGLAIVTAALVGLSNLSIWS